MSREVKRKRGEKGQKERTAGNETEIEASESGALIRKVLPRGFQNENKSRGVPGRANFLGDFCGVAMIVWVTRASLGPRGEGRAGWGYGGGGRGCLFVVVSREGNKASASRDVLRAAADGMRS